MLNFETCFTVVAAALIFNSTSIFPKTEKRPEPSGKTCVALYHENAVKAGQNDKELSQMPLRQVIEAEKMNLINYQIDSSGTSTYIKLTSSTGIATFNFNLPSGKYIIDVRYKSESVGQNTYAMYINNKQIVAWLGKDRDDQWHKLSEQRWHIPKNILINKGDQVKVEAMSENGSFAIFDYIEFTESEKARSVPLANFISIYPDEYEHAIKNPLKGFRPSTIYSGIERRVDRFNPSLHEHEYGTLIKNYFRWNELENSADDTAEKIKQVCDIKWSGVENKNIKIIPRVYLDWPNRKSGWPEDMTTGDFTSDQFKQRVVSFIKKLGQAWDNDSRVAYVEMGLIGEWGEMEWPDTRDDIKEAIAAQFSSSFQNKKIMIRWPDTYYDDIFNFGYYWDSFAHHDQLYYAFRLLGTAPRWKTAVIGGETAYNWGHVQIQPGNSPNESLSNPTHRDYIIDKIRKLHANHLGWIADYDQNNESVRAGAEMVQKALGYRFVLTKVTYPKRIDTNTLFTVSLKVKNTGSSPFYYNWPVEVSLLDPGTKHVVWKRECQDIDIKNWMPGDQWDDSTDTYKIPAETHVVNQSFLLSDIPAGEYVLALAILDPAGHRPAVRFAIKNYYNGGRHPIGKVGINLTLDSFPIVGFDDIQRDTSLSYDKVVK